MARSFAAASSQYLTNSNQVADAPLTMACWFYATDNGAGQTLMSIGTTGAANEYSRLLVDAGTGGGTDHQVNAYIFEPVIANNTWTSTTYSQNTWHHAAASFNSSGHATVYLDAGGKTTDSASTVSITNATTTTIGRTERNSPAAGLYINGRIAEAGIWNVQLTDAEVSILATGISPLAVRPQSLVAYWPLIGRTSPEIDIVGGYDMTLTNAPTTAAHPAIMYPKSYQDGLTIPQTGDALLLEYSS